MLLESKAITSLTWTRKTRNTWQKLKSRPKNCLLFIPGLVQIVILLTLRKICHAILVTVAVSRSRLTIHWFFLTHAENTVISQSQRTAFTKDANYFVIQEHVHHATSVSPSNAIAAALRNLSRVTWHLVLHLAASKSVANYLIAASIIVSKIVMQDHAVRAMKQ